MKKTILTLFKWFLPVLFISYMSGITLFTHSHVVNGVTIVHSHPFKKGTEHQHTTHEVQLIHYLSHFQVIDGGALTLTFLYIPLFIVVLLTACLCIGYHSLPAKQIRLRAPPSSFSC